MDQPADVTSRSIRRAVEARVRGLQRWQDDTLDWTYRRRLHIRKFSVLGDDCWAGELYQALHVEYQTPFVGLLMGPDDFLEIARDPARWLGARLTFTSTSKNPSEHEAAHGYDYPIGRLDGEVELKFLHYGSQSEARDKWHRRVDRVSFDNLLFKFGGDTKDYPVDDKFLVDFDALPSRGVCFTSRPRPDLRKGVHVPHFTTDGAAMYRRCLATFDPVDWVNGGSGRPSLVDRAGNIALNRRR